MSYHMRDIGHLVVAKPGTPSISITAAGSGDASEVSGAAIDRYSLAQGRGQSAVLAIQVTGTVTSGKTVSVVANFQDSANNSDWTDYGTALSSTTVLNAAGAALTASSGVVQLGVSLGAARRYIRAQVTADCSATQTDTALLSSVIVIGGQSQTPAS